VSWATTSGVYLIGGEESVRTSEKVKLDGSVEEGFSLKYDTEFACSISDPDNEEVIITGGGEYPAVKTVSVYSEAGWKRDLKPLNQGRYEHACGSYINGGKKFLMVTGGAPAKSNSRPRNYLDSTEIFSDNVWRTVAAKLPTKLLGPRVATINNRVLLFGGEPFDGWGVGTKDILEFNHETESWSVIGAMKWRKLFVSVSVVSIDDYEKWCN